MSKQIFAPEGMNCRDYVSSLGGFYNNISVFAYVDEAYNYWSDVFKNDYYIVRILPISSTDNIIGNFNGEEIEVMFKKS